MMSEQEQNEWKAWYEPRLAKIMAIETAFYMEGENGHLKLDDQGRAELIFKMRGDPEILQEYSKLRTGVGDSDHFIIGNMTIKNVRFSYVGRNVEPEIIQKHLKKSRVKHNLRYNSSITTKTEEEE